MQTHETKSVPLKEDFDFVLSRSLALLRAKTTSVKYISRENGNLIADLLDTLSSAYFQLLESRNEESISSSIQVVVERGKQLALPFDPSPLDAIKEHISSQTYKSGMEFLAQLHASQVAPPSRVFLRSTEPESEFADTAVFQWAKKSADTTVIVDVHKNTVAYRIFTKPMAFIHDEEAVEITHETFEAVASAIQHFVKKIA